MKSLQSIQKTFKVFQILTKIAFVFSVVGASICAVGALCAVTWYNGGQVLSIFGEPIKIFSDYTDMLQNYSELLAEIFVLSADAILLGFAHSYLKTEQSEGTPFTEKGATLLRKLGIRCIYIPIVAIVIATAITACVGVPSTGDFSNLPSLATGIVLIITSLIFRYGADLEQQNNANISEKDQ